MQNETFLNDDDEREFLRDPFSASLHSSNRILIYKTTDSRSLLTSNGIGELVSAFIIQVCFYVCAFELVSSTRKACDYLHEI